MPEDDLSTAELTALPKVELHVHLEGSVSAPTAIELAHRHGLDPAEVLPLKDGRYPVRFTSFAEFVDLYLAVSALIRAPEDLELIAASFAESQAAQGIVYTEATFTATTHVTNGMEPGGMWEALEAGLGRNPTAGVRLIVDTPRDLGVAAAEQLLELVESSRAPIAGLGLSGVEGSVPEGEFKALRAGADALGLGLAVHAGETGPPERIWAALDDLGADRIGHGVAAVREDALMRRLYKDGIPLEVCPSSNVVLGVSESLEAHPLKAMWERGLNVTVNSDDPPFFETTLVEELEHAIALCGLARRDVVELQRRAARAAFLPELERERLESLVH